MECMTIVGRHNHLKNGTVQVVSPDTKHQMLTRGLDDVIL
jgi:hypothetical protein